MLCKCDDRSSDSQNSEMPGTITHVCNPIASTMSWEAGVGESCPRKLSSVMFATVNKTINIEERKDLYWRLLSDLYTCTMAFAHPPFTLKTREKFKCSKIRHECLTDPTYIEPHLEQIFQSCTT